jgi:hypothetical protein
MDVVSIVLGALTFAALVPGVLVRLPPRGSKTTVLIVHALLFAALSTIVMRWYWAGREHMGNYGQSCPNGFTMVSDGNCVPTGQQTYDSSMQSKSSA